MAIKESSRKSGGPEIVAGNGLIDRRALLGRGIVYAGAVSAGVGTSLNTAAAEPLAVDPWSMEIGAVIPAYGTPSKYESKVVRTLTNPNGEPRTQQARTPHHLLDGTITPAGLHYVVSRTGIPDIDPAKHRLAIHGLVKQPLVFTLDALARYPKVSRISFVECGGNSAPLFSKDPVQANVQAIHGLLSCSEWSGVQLSTLLEEAGIDPKAKWFLAEGADGPSMNRSIPLAKALDDAMIALYQNGERIAPSNGYPMRLLLPGYEGNMNVKWLHRIKLLEAPVMAINETMEYTLLRPDGKAWQFYFPMEVKSFVTNPSPGLTLQGPGCRVGGGALGCPRAGLRPPLSRVEDWRAGLGRSLCSLLARSFVCECHTISTMPRFQPPPRRTQHAGFLALRSPVCFAPRLMSPILPERLSAPVVQPDSRRTGPMCCTAIAYSIASSRSPVGSESVAYGA